MENDLISVLIPAYNVEKYISRCLRSVLKQTYQNLEIIIVDDGSVDQTYVIAKKFADSDPRIVLLQKANENNVAKTRNFLLDHCHGKYCVWVDSDDCVKSRYVEKLYQDIQSQNADLSICRYAIRTFALPILPTFRKRVRIIRGDEIIPQIIYKTAFMLWNKMYRMSIINGTPAIRFDVDYPYGEDLLFNLQYAQLCQKIVFNNERLYSYFWRAGSETHKEFSRPHIDLVNRLMELSANETNPIVRENLYGWTAFSCCSESFLAGRHSFPDEKARMNQFAYQHRQILYKNHLAKLWLKCIMWVGLKTWCRPKSPRVSKKK